MNREIKPDPHYQGQRFRVVGPLKMEPLDGEGPIITRTPKKGYQFVIECVGFVEPEEQASTATALLYSREVQRK